MMSLHVEFTRLAFRLLPLVALLVGLAARAAGIVPTRVALVWFAVSALLFAYAALLQWGPSLQTMPGLITYVVAQKMISVILVAAVLHQAREFEDPPAHAIASHAFP